MHSRGLPGEVYGVGKCGKLVRLGDILSSVGVSFSEGLGWDLSLLVVISK